MLCSTNNNLLFGGGLLALGDFAEKLVLLGQLAILSPLAGLLVSVTTGLGLVTEIQRLIFCTQKVDRQAKTRNR